MLGNFFLTMTRKPTRLTHINNATINRHDVLHPSEKSFVAGHRVRLDLACHSFSTKVKGFLLQNFHMLANQTILFTAYTGADAQLFTSVKLNETSGVVLATFAKYTHAQQHSWASCGATFQIYGSQYFRCPGVWYGDGSMQWNRHPTEAAWNEGFLAARNRSNLKD